MFGYAVPAVTLGLVWWRREALWTSATAGSSIGILIVFGSLVAFLICQRLSARSPAAWFLGLLLLGIAVYLWGWSAARVLAFPIGFLAFALGLQQTLIAPFAFSLQHVTAIGSENLTRTLGLTVIREDLVLRSNEFAFVVAEACSGMSSLLALLGLASLLIYIVPASFHGRVVVILSVAPLVVIANIVRVSLVLFVASWFGGDAALGFFHLASSLMLFGLALGGLLVVSKGAGVRIWAAI
jgi:exosortase